MTSSTRSIVGLLLASGCLAWSGCDGGAEAYVVPSGASDSFSPAKGTGADGAPATELWWRHRMNGGMPLQLSTGLTMTFGDRLTRVLDG